MIALGPDNLTEAATEFTDLSESHWAEDEITYLAERNVIEGYPNGDFGLGDHITRAEATSFLARELELTSSPPTFTDVDSGHWAAGSIGAAADAGIITGYPDGSFQPDEPIERDEVAAILDRAYTFDSALDAPRFSDVGRDAWAFDSIQDLAARYITVGYPDRLFHPDEFTTREEFSVFLARTLNESFTPVVTNPEELTVLVNKERSLPADYVPANLMTPEVYMFGTEKMKQAAGTALEDLFAAATQDGLQLIAVSGYRSYDEQERIFQNYAEQYGIEQANQFSARPGESEHQTGLAMDVSSSALSSGEYLSTEFAQTAEGQWVQAHASDYGFIIRYPEGKESITGYQYEPWHLRYVGQEAAQSINQHSMTLETYLGTE
ncbi:D-alanyl-D-alanine carboxypeptidase family protein [Planococcus lenghuensis]|nr:D-alanyl-D-alanine carboxypeptidase family protein [Planococcus lenghuensis]